MDQENPSVDEGGYWHFSVVNAEGVKTVGARTSSGLARGAIVRLRGIGDRAFLRFDYPGRPDVEFDVDRPTLRHALALRGFGVGPHFTGQNIADMLGVDLAKLHEALRPLEESGLLEVSDRNRVNETWHRVAPVADLDDLLRRAERLSVRLDVLL